MFNRHKKNKEITDKNHSSKIHDVLLYLLKRAANLFSFFLPVNADYKESMVKVEKSSQSSTTYGVTLNKIVNKKSQHSSYSSHRAAPIGVSHSSVKGTFNRGGDPYHFYDNPYGFPVRMKRHATSSRHHTSSSKIKNNR